MAKRVLITGESGFIGSHLVKLLSGSAIPAHFQLFDVERIKKRFQETKPDVVVHLAAISIVAQCDADPDLAVKTNIGGTENVLSSLAELGQKPHFIFFSSAHVYDMTDSKTGVIDEQSRVNPQNLYAKTKVEGEQLAEKYAQKAGIASTVLRVFNHVHHTQRQPTFLSSLYHEFLQRKESGSDAPIPVGNLDLYRDIGAVSDLLDAVGAVINRGPITPYQVMNVCNGQKRKLRDLAEIFAREAGVKNEFKIDPSRIRKVDPESVVGSHDKITKATGWSPKVKSNEDLIRSFLEDL